MTQRFWFFPAIDLLTYIKKYPFVFIFSLLSAFSGAFGTILNLGLFQRPDMFVPGFGDLVRIFQLGIPFFAILHLLLKMTWLGRVKSPVILYALGLAALLVLLIYLSGDEALDHSILYHHFYTFLILLLLVVPIIPWLHSVQRQWVYLTDLALCGASTFLAYSFFSFLLDMVSGYFPSTQLGGLVGNGGMESFSFFQSLVLYLIVPWYLTGFLDKAIEVGNKDEVGGAVGMALASSSIIVLLVFYLVDTIVLLSWLFQREVVLSTYVPFFLATCGLGLANLVLITPLRLWKSEIWMEHYRKLVGVFSLLVIAVTYYGLFHEQQEWEMTGYLELLTALWLTFTVLYALREREWAWGKSLLGLTVLMAVTLVGPLNPRLVSFHFHRAKLGVLLTEAGMMKEGKVQKPEASLDQDLYSKIQEEFGTIATITGLSRLQSWFSFDLKPIGMVEESMRRNGDGYTVAGRLMETLGVEICNTLAYTESAKSFGTKRGDGPLDISGYSQEQRVDFRPGCPVIRRGVNDQMYVVGLSDQNRVLTVQFGSEFLADVPLEKINQVLKAHNYSEVFRYKIPQNDLSVAFENNKVKVKVYFDHIQAISVGADLRPTSGHGVLLVQRK